MISKNKISYYQQFERVCLGCFFMLLCARVRGQGMRVCLGWCARLISSVLLLLPRRKRSVCGLHCLLTLLAPPLGGYLACGVYRLSRVCSLPICCSICIVLLGGRLVAFCVRFRIGHSMIVLFLIS